MRSIEIVVQFATGLRAVYDAWVAQVRHFLLVIDFNVASHNDNSTIEDNELLGFVSERFANTAVNVGQTLTLLAFCRHDVRADVFVFGQILIRLSPGVPGVDAALRLLVLRRADVADHVVGEGNALHALLGSSHKVSPSATTVPPREPSLAM
jgi:hypothetical protein